MLSLQIIVGLYHLLYKYLAVCTMPFVVVADKRGIKGPPPSLPFFVERCGLCATTLFRTRVDTAPACSNRGDLYNALFTRDAKFPPAYSPPLHAPEK